MKRTEFKKLKVGDLVVTNGMCRKKQRNPMQSYIYL